MIPNFAKVVREMALYVENSGVTVTDSDGPFEDELVIASSDGQEVVLKYGDREHFKDRAIRMAEDSGLDIETCYLAAAKSYVECCFD